jgi:hypothetical protein
MSNHDISHRRVPVSEYVDFNFLSFFSVGFASISSKSLELMEMKT